MQLIQKNLKYAEVPKNFFLSLMIFRARRSHWENLQPTSGRPFSSALRELDSQWGNLKVAGKNMIQQKTLTTDEELHKLAVYAETH